LLCEARSLTLAVLHKEESRMSVKKNKAAVMRWNEEIITNVSSEQYDEVLADNYRNVSAGIDKKGMLERFQQFMKDHPTWHVKIEDIIGEGDKVAIHLSAFESDKKISEGFSFYRLVKGKIADDWYCFREVADT